MWEFLPHQKHKAQQVYQTIKIFGMCYLMGEVRSGKSATAILVAEMSKAKNILILTPKGAIEGFQKAIDNLPTTKNYIITNYEQAHKLDSNQFDFYIQDESHRLGTLAKPSQRIKNIRALCYDKHALLMSGTAIVESPNSIYHQCCVTKYSPFKHTNFYKFFAEYGVESQIYLGGRQVKQYDKYKPHLLNKIKEFTVVMKQTDAGINLSHNDELHYIELSEQTKKLYNEALTDSFIQTETLDHPLESEMAQRVALHQIESGVLKVEDSYHYLGNLEKINYLKNKFQMSDKTVVLAHYVAEQRLLKEHFPNCTVESATSKAEGVSYAWAEEFIIFSSGYSGAKFIQRNQRVIDINGSQTLSVHHILVKDSISEQVYNTCSRKQDFNNKTFNRKEL